MATKSSRQVSVVLRDCTLYFSEDEDSEDWQKMLQGHPSSDLLDPLDSSIVDPEIMINSEGEEDHHLENPHIPEEVQILPEPISDDCFQQMTEECYEILELKKTLLSQPLQASDKVETCMSSYISDKTPQWTPISTPEVSMAWNSSIMDIPKAQTKLEPQMSPVDQCAKTFKVKRPAPVQAKIFIPEMSYICVNCGISFSSAEDLKKLPSGHKVGALYLCPNCGRKLFQKNPRSGDQTDTIAENPYSCTECTKSFQNDDDLTRHQAFHLSNPYWCAECNENFKNNRSLKAHRSLHLKERRLACKECGSKFENSFDLVVHRQIHNKKVEKPKKPEIKCRKRSYTGDQPVRCTTCDKCFGHQSELKVHERLHTG